MEKLIKIQQELKAPKGQRNNFGNYNYRSCEDILEAVKPILKDLNVALIINDDVVNLGDRYYIKATAKLINNDGNTIIENSAFAREEENKKGMDGSQITGASSSYARKYALNGLFAIDDTKDSDYTNTEEKATTKDVLDAFDGARVVNNNLQEEIKQYIQEKQYMNVNAIQVYNYMKKNNFVSKNQEDLTKPDVYKKLIDWFDKNNKKGE